MKEKILIGMSGGVDSSVSALLLKEAGYDVAGITMLLKPPSILSEEEKQQMYQEAEDAAAVCRVLGIKHYMPDFSELFRHHVIDYFAEEYFSGRTPNPCIMCNQNLKFGKMLDFALEHGYDRIATGHYAVITKEHERYLLKRADSPKDQSYFLYGMTQHQLAHTLFPLERLEKSDARALAEKHGLPVAHKPDSQEVCFIKKNDYAAFLESYTGKTAPAGNFVDENGSVLGKHNGIYRYTIGQRKGLGITFGEPRYVVSINPSDHTVTLGRDGSQYRRELTASRMNYIPFDSLSEPLEVTVKIRYQAKPAPALVEPLESDRVRVTFFEPQRSVTPGQAVVLYDNDTVIGGGIID